MIGASFFAQFGPVFCRAIGMIAILPWGNSSLSLNLRVTLAAGLSLLVSGTLPEISPLTTSSLVGELIVGLALGIPLALAVQAFAMAGEMIDVARGQQIAALYDPLADLQTSPCSVLFGNFAWVAALCSGLLDSLIISFVRSFSLVPLDSAFGTSNLKSIASGILTLIPLLLGGIFGALMPLIGMMLAVDLAIGFVSKFIPQLALQSEAFQIKLLDSMLGVIALSRIDIGRELVRMARVGVFF